MKINKNFLIKLLVSGTLLVIIFSKINKESLLDNLKLLNFWYVPIILLLIVANYSLGAVRWKYLLLHDKEDKIRVKYLVYLYFVGAFFNNFMPTSIGGDVYRVYRLGKRLGSTVDAFAATFMERFTGVLALILISIFSLFDLIGWWSAGVLILFIAGFFVGLYLLKIFSKKFQRLQKIYQSLIIYKGQSKTLIVAFAISVVIQFIAISTQYCVFLAIGQHPPLLYAFFILPLITLAGFVIPSINGVGVQDALYIKFFSVVGISHALSLSASIVYHLSRLTISLVGGLVYVIGKDD